MDAKLFIKFRYLSQNFLIPLCLGKDQAKFDIALGLPINVKIFLDKKLHQKDDHHQYT